jgi:drug/metabolite transporter (DMT)-like permease
LLVLLTMGLAWGLSFSLAKIATTGGAQPLGISLWQCWIAGVLLTAVTLTRRRPIQSTRPYVTLYVILALLGLIVPTALFYYAASHVSAGVLSITVALVPILTFLTSALLGLERVTRPRMAGVVLGTAAIVLLVAPSQSLPDRSQLPWVMLAFGSALCYSAMNIVITLRTPPGANSFVMTCGMFLAASVMLIPIVYVTGHFTPMAWPWSHVEWSIIGLGLISGTAYTLYFYLIEQAGPVFTSQVANVVTLCGVLWGIALFGEQHSAWVWLSLATMMAALTLVAPRPKPAPVR